MDMKYEAVKAVVWNIGASVDLLSLKAFWRIACTKGTTLIPEEIYITKCPGLIKISPQTLAGYKLHCFVR